jgi:2-polyprenyl-3-methyl-5-hydroxy-6-metoxy-1,4-benzoquinol methylase
MEEDRSKWNERYSGAGFFLGPRPSQFLAEQLERLIALCPGRRALDIACGEGRNSIFLARHGFAVTGIDISEKGIAKARQWMEEEGLAIDFRVADLENYTLTATYDLIINFNFLLREMIPAEVDALSPGGLLVFDTILDTPSLVGCHTRRFLLRQGELPTLFAPFPGAILHHEEFPCAVNPTARLIFRKSTECPAP